MGRTSKAVLIAVLALGTPRATARADDWSLTRPSRESAGRAGKGKAKAKASRARANRRPAAAAASRDRSAVLAARYLRVLLRDPDQRFARERLFELRRASDRGLGALAAQLAQLAAEPGASAAAHVLLGHVEVARGRPAQARAAFEKGRTLSPRSAAPLRALAELALTDGQLSDARKWLRAALDLVSGVDRSMLLQQLGELALQQKDYEAARGHFERLAQAAKGTVHARTAMAQALVVLGEHGRAVQEYRRVLSGLAGDPRVLPPVLLQLARAQRAAGDPAGAVETLARAQKMTRNRPGLRHEIRELLVECHRDAGDLAAYAEELAQTGGRGFDTQSLLGRIAEELGRPDQAVDAYRRALRARPQDEGTHLRLISLLEQQGDVDTVIAARRALMRALPREPGHVLSLAQLLLDAGQRSEAMSLMASAERRFRRDVAFQRGANALYERWGEVASATRALRALVRLQPKEPAHLVVLGEHLLSHGDTEGALAAWKRILRVDRDRARAHATIGDVYLEHDRIVEALGAFEQAVALRPDELAYVRGYAEALERAHRGTQAVEQWQHVLELAGEDRSLRREARRHIVDIWHGRGELASKLERFERAFGWSVRSGAMPVDEPDLEAGRFLAEGYARLAKRRRRGRVDGDATYARAADAVLARVVALSPDDVETLLAMERSMAGRGDTAGAIEVLQRLAEVDPGGAKDYLARMAKHSLSLYRDADAVEYARRAVQLNPSDAIAHRRLGDLYRGRQSTAEAIASYQRAIELDPRLFGVHFALAELHLAAGEPLKAERLLRAVIRAAPDQELVMRAARAAIQLGVAHDGLASLEDELLPLALGNPDRPVFRRALVELYDAYARPLVYHSEGSGPRADEARAQLMRIGQRAVRPLLEALADEDPSQQRVAIDILGYVGNPHAAAPLLRVAEQAGPMEVRLRALRAAAAVATSQLVPRLAELAAGPQRRLRAMATWGLARAGGPAAERALAGLLRSSTPAVRGYALLAMGFADATGAAAAAQRMLEADRSGFVRGCAALAVGMQSSDPDAAAQLGSTLRLRSGPEAMAAATALGWVDTQEAVDVLASAAFVADPQLRAAALGALSRSLSQTAAPGIERLPAPRARPQVPWLLKRLVGTDVAALPSPLPARLLSVVASSGAAALSGPLESVRAVLSVIESPRLSAALRHDLVTALAGSLAKLVSHAEPAIRARALRALAGVDAPQVVPAVLGGLADASPQVVQAALGAVAQGAPPEGALLERLQQLAVASPQWSHRRAAVRLLGRVVATDSGARHVVAARLSSDAYAFVREAAADALVGARSPAAASALRDAVLRDKSAHVRRSAARALSVVDAKAAAELARSPDLEAALRALLTSAN